MRLTIFDIEEAKAGRAIVTRDGREVKYIRPHSDKSSVFEIRGRQYVINNNGRASDELTDSKYDLFLVSGDDGPSMFEDTFRRIILEDRTGKHEGIPNRDLIKNSTDELLGLVMDYAKETVRAEIEENDVEWRFCESETTMPKNVVVIRSLNEGEKNISLVKKVRSGEFYLTLEDLEKIKR